jgi:hypothetical protein
MEVLHGIHAPGPDCGSKLHPYANPRPDAARQLAEHLVTVLGDETDVCGDPPSNGLRVY